MSDEKTNPRRGDTPGQTGDEASAHPSRLAQLEQSSRVEVEKFPRSYAIAIGATLLLLLVGLIVVAMLVATGAINIFEGYVDRLQQ